VFGEAQAAYYAEDLGRLATAIAARDCITFLVLGCACRSTNTYAQLEGRWDAGERDLGDDVREALLAGALLVARRHASRHVGRAHVVKCVHTVHKSQSSQRKPLRLADESTANLDGHTVRGQSP
jgi:hypothetical protein